MWSRKSHTDQPLIRALTKHLSAYSPQGLYCSKVISVDPGSNTEELGVISADEGHSDRVEEPDPWQTDSSPTGLS